MLALTLRQKSELSGSTLVTVFSRGPFELLGGLTFLHRRRYVSRSASSGHPRSLWLSAGQPFKMLRLGCATLPRRIKCPVKALIWERFVYLDVTVVDGCVTT